jgi:hypothetical protein
MNKNIAIILVLAVMIMTIMVFKSEAQDTNAPVIHRLHGALDGKTFIGKIALGESKQGIEGTIAFREGKLHANAGDSLDFGYGAYTTRKDSVGIVFEATTIQKDNEDGNFEWHGTVIGQMLKATMVCFIDSLTQQKYTVTAKLMRVEDNSGQ